MPFNTPADNGAANGDEQGDGPRNKTWAAALQHLVRILAGYGGLRFVPFYVLKKHGETEENTPRRWRTILGMEEIQYLIEDIDSPEQDVALGRAAHEAWHVVFSRPELIFDAPKELLESMAFQALWWSVEDARVNVLGLSRHEGARPWIDAAYDKDYTPKDLASERERWAREIPLHLQFNYALIYEWWSGRRDPRISDKKVHDALDAAKEAIRRAYSTADARRSFDVIQHEIWPIYKELIDEAYEREQQKRKQKGQKGEGEGEGDQDQQDQDQDQDSDSQSQSSSSGSKPGKPQQGKPGQQKQKKRQPVSDDVKKEMEKKEREQRDKHASKMVDKPEKMSQEQREKAKKEMEKLREKMGQKDKQEGQDAQQASDSDSDSDSDSQAKPQSEDHKKKQRERMHKPDLRPEVDKSNEDKYREYYMRVRHLVPVMRAQFLQVLKRRVRRRTIHDRKSGDLDEEALEQLPSNKPDPFIETVSANKSLYRISLLIDTSGSMSGEKKERAIEGAVMLMETLEKLPGVSYEIVAFDSTPKVIKAYTEKVTPVMKAAVVRAIIGGSGSTESHVAVEQALERIRMGRGDKLMIMVNDGDPDNNFNRDQYRAMVEKAKDVDIHGIGLGPEAQLVLDLFPPGRGWWLKDVADFAKNLRNIIKKKLLGS
jgi:hypothetical protein